MLTEVDRTLLGAWPAAARTLLVLGDAPALADAARAAGRVVYVEESAVAAGSLDGVLLVGALARALDPVSLLRRLRRLVRPEGVLLVASANAQHHARLTGCLTGDVSASEPALSWGQVFRHLLNAGFAPTLAGCVSDDLPEARWQALQPLLASLRLHPARTRRHLAASHLIISGKVATATTTPTATQSAEPLSFVVCVNDEQQLRANLLASPCLGPGSPHEVLAYANCTSAAAGLNLGLREAQHDRVVGLHQDVYLPPGWDRAFVAAWDAAEAKLGRAGVVGVYGVRLQGGRVERAGYVVDRERLLREPEDLPAPVDTLDELLLGVRRGAGLAFEPGVGFHFYGADACLQARARGLHVVALDALCWHNSRSVDLPAEFHASAAAFARKWRTSLPVATSCVVVQADGSCRLS